ncbi:DUF2273 domain-containing protein [Arthrobacter psychrolactophilus]|uniref:DUF2273 domain-containing protein n=1 Tax=Arthrobacter psychrolactophilus TaxID=92442 RepID=A0A2V5JM00_9MICC|nr:DUF2273 domain-containing protein [Arthrobacter psychrolactophilus]PYI38956.1 hypothetical protein CVS30_06480 [Arthrobacter psychrolactophilus]
MSATLAGIAIAATLAISALAFGFWAMLLVALFMAVGAVIGRSLDGRLDLRGVLDALRGKRTSS